MFTTYKNITNPKSVTDIDLKTLISLIKAPSNVPHMQYLHTIFGTEEYDKEKMKLPCITPHGIFSPTRNKLNFRSFSRYMYFDVDCYKHNLDVDLYKEKIINKHQDHIALLGKSLSNKGLFFYVPIQNFYHVNVNNFLSIWKYVKDHVFGDIIIDENAAGITRLHVTPYDADLWTGFFIEDIDIPHNIIQDINDKCKSIAIPKDIGEDISYSFSKSINDEIPYTSKANSKDMYGITQNKLVPLSEILPLITLKTHVEVEDDLFDIKPVLFAETYIPRIIPKGNKRKTFCALVCQIMYLNPGIDLKTVQSFIVAINANYTGDDPMDIRGVLRIVEFAFTTYDERFAKTRIKNVHFRKNSGLTKGQKIGISNTVNGAVRRQNTIDDITRTIALFIKSGMDQKFISKKAVAAHIGKTVRTVQLRWDEAIKALD